MTVSKRTALGVLTRARLLNVAARAGHDELTSKRKEEIVEALASSRRAALAELLAHYSRDDLERRILVWVEQRARRSPLPEGDASAEGFAKSHNLGLQRARRADDGLAERHEPRRGVAAVLHKELEADLGAAGRS